MSKNFELLQRLGKDQQMFDTGTEALARPPLQVTADPLQVTPEPLTREERKPVESRPLNLEMDQSQRDELTRFVQQLFLVPESKAPRSVVLTSPEPETGCSWICCRAAAILAAQLKEPVCVVDANLRYPRLHEYFGVDNPYGLAEALGSEKPIRDFVRQLGNRNLWLLSSGAVAKDSASLLMSDSVPKHVAELLQYFRYVLIDAPAVNLGSDAISLGRAAEGVVMVLKAHASRRASSRKAIEDLNNVGIRIFGAVLNRRTFPIPQALYDKL
jgi:Mrp family chromosome partitioning ATPase